MTHATWGYAGQVGQWLGAVEVPADVRGKSLAATDHVLGRFIPPLAELHRPRAARISWAEYGEDQRETGYHELEQVTTMDWQALRHHVQGLRAAAHGVELHSLFIDLDTSIVESTGTSWQEQSATFQISIVPPELGPFSLVVMYATYIDVWLSTTYDDEYVPRSNHDVSSHNRPRLEAFLRRFAGELDGPVTVDRSQLYSFAITATGFRDADNLPPRSR